VRDPAATTPQQITERVLRSFDECPDDRLRELMLALAGHLHAFASEVGLASDEWEQAITALTRSGEITDEHRQEFVLWSDALGLSMLVDALEHSGGEGGAAGGDGGGGVGGVGGVGGADRGRGEGGEGRASSALPVTESTVLGPFYVPGAPRRGYGESIAAEGDAGEPVWVHGRVLGTDGEPIAGAELDIWQNGDDRLYAVQRPEAPKDHLRGRFETRPDGSFGFIAVRPVSYPIPDDGPVGEMLRATGRHPWRPAHIHMIVRAAGHRTLTTHIFDADSDYLDSDAVFAVKSSLVHQFTVDQPTPDGAPALSVPCDLVLAPAGG
jgi:hydroxyquinol 1,2-dioxygenase